jgi:predicted P-loop ATPase
LPSANAATIRGCGGRATRIGFPTAHNRPCGKKAWVQRRISHLGSKDAIIDLTGKLIVEVAELDALEHAASSTAKGFITRDEDNYRPPYGRHSIGVPRQSTLWGSVNPPAEGYLKDTTGNRRYWPIACSGKIDIVGLKHNLDQLYAEAVVRYRNGAEWWLETDELEALAAAEQNLRLKPDPWLKPIKNWLGQRKEVTIKEVMQGALGINPEIDEQVHSAEIRISKILQNNLEFKQGWGTREGKRCKVYRRV